MGLQGESWAPGPESSPTHSRVWDRSAVRSGRPVQASLWEEQPHSSLPLWPWGCSPALSCPHQGQIGPRCKLSVSRVGSLLPAWGKGYTGCRQLGTCLHLCWACLWGQHIPALFPPLILSPSPFLPHASAQASGTSQRGTGRETRLVRWLGTYQHLPAAPLPFSSRPHPLKGLMHLPLSCCEMQRLKNSSTGSPGRRGEGGEGASRSRRLSGWPQRPALHLNEQKGLTGSNRGCWGQAGRDSSILTTADPPAEENHPDLGKHSLRC